MKAYSAEIQVHTKQKKRTGCLIQISISIIILATDVNEDSAIDHEFCYFHSLVFAEIAWSSFLIIPSTPNCSKSYFGKLKSTLLNLLF